METQYHAAQDTESELAEALKEQEQSALELNKIAIPYNVLQRQVESDRALYDSVLGRLKETDVTKNLDEDNIRLMEPPLLPERPIKPRRTLIMAVSLLAGSLFGGVDLLCAEPAG